MVHHFRSTLNILVAVAMFLNYSGFSYAVDLPQVAGVVAGTADFSTVGNTMNITASDQAIINYNQFNIGAQNTVNFIQPSSTAVALNRVIGGQASSIYGALNANGRIFLVNPNGILFAPGSRVDAAGLIASTMGISNENFLNGNYSFERNGANGSVNNQGQIMIRNGGYLGLFAPEVRNSGSVLADMGTVMLASGEAATVSLDDNADVSVVVDPGQVTGITNSGTIRADGGKVLLTAKSLNAIFDNAINNTGVIQANSLEGKNGEIYLTANGRVNVDGTVSVLGGKVQVDSEGADYKGIIKAAQGIFNAHGGDTFLDQADVTGADMTWIDAINIFIVGNLNISGNATFSAGGAVEQAAGTKIYTGGSISMTAEDIYLHNVFFGGADFTANAYGIMKVGDYTDHLGGTYTDAVNYPATAAAIGDGRIVSINGPLITLALDASDSGSISQANPNTAYAETGNKFDVNGGDGLTRQIWGWADFDLSAYGTIYIDSGRLLLGSSGSSSGATLNLYNATGLWTSTARVWNSKPSISPDSLGSATIPKNNDDANLYFNVRDSLQQSLTTTDGKATFFVKANPGQDARFWDMSAPANKTHPKLDISYYQLGSGDISIIASNGISVGQLITQGDVMLASGGAITDNNGDTLNVQYADTLLAYGATGIGAADALETDVNRLSALNAKSGDIWIRNDKGVTVADLDGFGGLINTSPDGKVKLDANGDIVIDALVQTGDGTTAGDIILNAAGDITQTANGDVLIDQVDSALLAAPTNVISTSHPTDAWQSGISNQADVDIQWQLPGSDLAKADYIATADGAYTMDAGAEIKTNGGDATIRAKGGDADLAVVNAGTGNISVTSDTGSISGDLIGRTAAVSAPLGSTAGVDFSAPGIGFSYVWENDATPSDPDVTAEPSITPVLQGGEWVYKKTFTATEDSMNWNFMVATVDGVARSAVVPLGAFYIDTAAPVITQGTVTGTAGNGGWYRSAVTVAFDATDNLSGVATSGALSVTGFDSRVISTEGIHQTVTSGVACDMAGNCTATGLTSSEFRIDWTAPTLTWGSLSTAPNAAGWNNTDVTLPYTTADNLSGVSSSDPVSPLSFTTEGANLTQDVIVIDVAGNSTTFTSPVVKLDKTAPTITAARDIAANANGWNNVDVTVSYTVGDALSGVLTGAPSDYADDVFSAEGFNQTASGIVYDLAGNSATATLTGISIDKTAPTITAARDIAANANGWNNVDVTVSYTVGDALSGVLTGSPSDYADDVFSSEGANQTASGIVYDLAGNSATATLTGISIDKTAPTITAARDIAANANGWNNVDVTVSYTVGDALSGVLTGSPSDYADDVFSSEGANQTASGIVYDLAGNSATATLTGISIDKTAPVITVGSQTGTQNPDGSWLPDVTVTFDATDNLSGFAPNPNPWTGFSSGTTSGTGAAVPVSSGSVTDLAGNTAPGITPTYNVVADEPPPPALLSADFLQPRFIYPHTERLAEKLVNPMDMITSAGLLITGQVFFYHPLSRVDDGSYNGFQLEEAAYDFIDGQIEPCDPTGKSGKPCRNN